MEEKVTAFFVKTMDERPRIDRLLLRQPEGAR